MCNDRLREHSCRSNNQDTSVIAAFHSCRWRRRCADQAAASVDDDLFLKILAMGKLARRINEGDAAKLVWLPPNLPTALAKGIPATKLSHQRPERDILTMVSDRRQAGFAIHFP
jgi:hypothetical protein